jgi:hypothetical protein
MSLKPQCSEMLCVCGWEGKDREGGVRARALVYACVWVTISMHGCNKAASSHHHINMHHPPAVWFLWWTWELYETSYSARLWQTHGACGQMWSHDEHLISWLMWKWAINLFFHLLDLSVFIGFSFSPSVAQNYHTRISDFHWQGS